MNKIFSLLVLTAAFGSAKGQLIASITTDKWVNNQWDSSEAIINFYAGNQLIIKREKEIKNPISSAWNLVRYDSILYTTQGNLSEEWSFHLDTAGALIKTNRSEYFYFTTSGQLDSVLESIQFDSFNLSIGYSYTYNTTGDLSRTVKWVNAPWRATERSTYFYNSTNQVSSIYHEFVPGLNAGWHFDYEELYSYNSTGYAIISYAINTGVTDTLNRVTYFLDASGKPTEVLTEGHTDGDGFTPIIKQIYTYNAAGWLESITEQNRTGFPAVWTNNMRYRFHYVSGVSAVEFTSMETTCFPNPTTNKVQVDFGTSRNYSFQVFNLNGQLMQQGKGTGAALELFTAQWPAGTYLIQGATEHGLFQSNFIKL